MPRLARIVLPGLPHHVTQRGNNRQEVFITDDDRLAYLGFLKQQCDRFGVSILGYCLMTNHVHLIPVPCRSDSLAKAIGRAHWLYTQHFNRVHHRSGHLWQNRFFSNAMDDDHCLVAMRYVEWNPIRARICRIATRYPWSSAVAHAGGKDKAGILDLVQWKQLAGGTDWQSVLATEPSLEQAAKIRRATRTGRPLAGSGFIATLERKLGRSLRPGPVGRPKVVEREGRK